MKFLFCVLLFLGASAGAATHPELKQELVEMARVDQEIRQQVLESHDWTLLEEVDALHLPRLQAIIAQYRWPGFQLVDEEGAMAMWLLVQHADRAPELQRACLALLEIAVSQKDASTIHYAYLLDRVLVNEGKPQVYGTQLIVVDSQWMFYPIEEEALVDIRRAALGLCTLEEYKQQLILAYAPPN